MMFFFSGTSRSKFLTCFFIALIVLCGTLQELQGQRSRIIDSLYRSSVVVGGNIKNHNDTRSDESRDQDEDFFSVNSNTTESNTPISKNDDILLDAIGKLPAWLQSYMKWHEQNRNDFIISQHHTTRFLVVVCQEGTKCGGLTDRLRSVLYWLREAEQTNRVLLIHWTKKFPLESFWVPPKGGLNWSPPSLPQLQLVEEQDEEAALSNVGNSSAILNLFGPSSCIYQEDQVIKVSTTPDEAARQEVFQTLQDDTKQLVCVQTQANLNQIVMDKDYYFSDDSSSNQAKTRGKRRRRNPSSDYDHDRTFGRIYQIMFTPSLPLMDRKVCRVAINAVMGFEPNHPAVNAMVKETNQRTQNALANNSNAKFQISYTGPWLWTNMTKMDVSVSVLHPHTFLPCPYKRGGVGKMCDNMEPTLRADSRIYAMHEWAKSW